MAVRLLDRLRGYFIGYLESYEKGRRRFGFWWIVFTASLLIIPLVLVLFAAGLYFFVLPGLSG
ncbi:MAG: hypothetical protein NTV61_07930 [Candidatus Bathyarchaeota archaeon]|nr:hypothetical protein [Candidatus Bathyarchaeota archaeon]